MLKTQVVHSELDQEKVPELVGQNAQGMQQLEQSEVDSEVYTKDLEPDFLPGKRDAVANTKDLEPEVVQDPLPARDVNHVREEDIKLEESHYSTVRGLLRQAYPDGWWETKLHRCINLEFGQWDLYDYWVEQIYYNTSDPRPKLLADLEKRRKACKRPTFTPI